MSLVIRKINKSDYDAVEVLTREAFCNDILINLLPIPLFWNSGITLMGPKLIKPYLSEPSTYPLV